MPPLNRRARPAALGRATGENGLVRRTRQTRADGSPEPTRSERAARTAAEAFTGTVGNAAVQRLFATRTQARDHDPASASTTAGERGATAAMRLDRDVVSDVKDRMSYSTFDWAITDAEAEASLYQLASLGAGPLSAALAKLGTTTKKRLLDNLPDSAKTTAAFTKVVVAMGPNAALPYLEDLLSYGVFDWAVTDNDAARVFRVIVTLPPAQRATLIDKLGSRFRNRLASNLKRKSVSAEEQPLVRMLFDKTPNQELETLRLWCEIRFRVEFGTEDTGRGPQEWDAKSLRRMYQVLDALPSGAVEGNPKLASIDRFKPMGGWSGYYAQGDEQIAMGYTSLTDTVGGSYAPGGKTPVPLHGQNVFDHIVRHEVGHAVDAKLGLSRTWCLDNANGGDWSSHGDGSGLAAVLVSKSGGAISGLAAAKKIAVTEALQESIEAAANVKAAPVVAAKIDALVRAKKISKSEAATVKRDPAVRTLVANVTKSSPWFSNSGGVHLGGRVYQQAYGRSWYSYDPAARPRRVSNYQFRAPGEWIADAYSAYYSPGHLKGARLEAVDKKTKDWFDTAVDLATGGTGKERPKGDFPSPAGDTAYA